MTNKKWLEDLERGEKVERHYLEKILAVFRDAYQTFGRDTRFDIKIPELDVSIEVKFDPKSLETGNIVVEYYHNQPSGLTVSEASHWLFVTGEEEIWISKHQLLKCILAEQINPVQIHGPEDRHPKWVFLVPVDQIQAYASATHSLGK